MVREDLMEESAPSSDRCESKPVHTRGRLGWLLLRSQSFSAASQWLRRLALWRYPHIHTHFPHLALIDWKDRCSS